MRLLTRRHGVSAGPPNNPATVLAGDPTDRTVCAEALDGVDAVVWATGDLLPSSTAADLASIDDLAPLTAMLEAIDRDGGVRFVFLSSGGTVYGNPEVLPVSETHPLRPLSVYGGIKAQAEHAVERAAERTDMAAIVLRCGNAYGPGQRVRPEQGVIARTMDCILHEQPLPLVGNPSSTRDYVFVDDITAVIEACVDGTIDAAVLNVGSGLGTTLGELLALIEVVAGHPTTVDAPTRSTDVDRLVLDISRLRQQLPAYDPTPLAVGLTRTWEAFRAERTGPAS